jgi:tripartite-type tricarboxylate transporter receptor subunit TctC
LPGYALTNWFGLAAPAATPRELVTKLHADFSKVLQQPEVRDRLLAMGADVVGSTPEQFGAFMRAETTKWARVIKEANIRAE